MQGGGLPKGPEGFHEPHTNFPKDPRPCRLKQGRYINYMYTKCVCAIKVEKELLNIGVFARKLVQSFSILIPS